MKRLFVGGNWKTKVLTQAEAEKLAGKIGNKHCPVNVEVAVFPQDAHLYPVGRILKSTGIGLGSQNIWQGIDPSTGELPIETLLDAGGKYALIGHSERRQHYGETDKSVNRRLLEIYAWRVKISPILCVGESFEQKKAKSTKEVLRDQIKKAFAPRSGMINAEWWAFMEDTFQSLIVAYEPVWAIGTGQAADPADAEKSHVIIRQCLLELCRQCCTPSTTKVHFLTPKELSQKIRIIYGGSVNPKNTEDLIAMPNIDGFLVGGASLNASDFTKIVNAAAHA